MGLFDRFKKEKNNVDNIHERKDNTTNNNSVIDENPKDIGDELISLYIMLIDKYDEYSEGDLSKLQLRFWGKADKLKKIDPNYKLRILGEDNSIDRMVQEFDNLVKNGDAYMVIFDMMPYSLEDLRKQFGFE